MVWIDWISLWVFYSSLVGIMLIIYALSWLAFKAGYWHQGISNKKRKQENKIVELDIQISLCKDRVSKIEVSMAKVDETVERLIAVCEKLVDEKMRKK